ncbi:MAG: GTPase [Candidatus Aenigmatarchaeota archaeon]
MENPFRRVKALETDEMIGNAFRSAAKGAEEAELEGDVVERARQKESLRIKIAGNYIYDKLKESSRSFPDFNKLPEAYKQLAKTLTTEEKFRKALASQIWAANMIRNLQMSYYGKMKKAKHTQDCREVRRQFYGRVSSLLRKIRPEMKLLKEIAPELGKMPSLQEMPTIAIAGLPNVGKSSLLASLSGSRPEIQPYPFTTKNLMLGYIDFGHKRLQLIDTPGLLDRPMAKRSKIEKQALVALQHIVDVVIYVFDMSETCGYTVEQQLRMYGEIKSSFNKAVIPVANKSDIVGRKETKELGLEERVIDVSCETGEGIEELKKFIKEMTKYI